MKLEDPLLILQQTQAIQIFPELIPILGKIYTKKHVTDIICNFIHSINQYNLSNPSLQIEKLFLLQSIVNANFYLASSSSTIKLVKNVVPILEKYFSSGNRKEKIECSYCLSVLLVSHFLLNTLLSFSFLSFLPSLPPFLLHALLSFPFFSFFPYFLLSSFLSSLPSLFSSFAPPYLLLSFSLCSPHSSLLPPLFFPFPLAHSSLLHISLMKETFFIIYYPLLRLPLLPLLPLLPFLLDI